MCFNDLISHLDWSKKNLDRPSNTIKDIKWVLYICSNLMSYGDMLLRLLFYYYVFFRLVVLFMSYEPLINHNEFINL